MTDRPMNVLFLCTANSARSILGEAILKEKGEGRFNAYSAGSQPRGTVHPAALELLTGLGHDVSWARSKSWDEFEGAEAPQMDFIFTVCDSAAAEVCPVWPGHPMTAHWGIPDPAAATGGELELREAFRAAYRMLDRRISVFVSLPFASLDALSLRSRLEAIGTEEAAAE